MYLASLIVFDQILDKSTRSMLHFHADLSSFADALSARSTTSQKVRDHYNSGEYFHKNHFDRYLTEQVGFFFFAASFIILKGTKNVRVYKAPLRPF